MARQVNQTLIDIARECGGWSDQEATAFVKELRQQGRYQEDVWS